MTFEEMLARYPKVFAGECHAVVLEKRGKNDLHICLRIMTKDDEDWYLSHNASLGSSHWLPEIIELLEKARSWMDENCVKTEWGLEFPEEFFQ